MRLDVLLGEALPTPADVAGRAVVVIDVLRASTVMVEALAQGARAVVPFAEVDDVVTAAKRYGRDEVRLAGERRSRAIAGFDAGNSPREMTAELVAGRTLLMTTTNGTNALVATHGAWRTWVGAFTNLSVTARAVIAALDEGRDATLVCSGQERRFALEDAVCAGAIAREILAARPDITVGDAARVAERLAASYDGDLACIAQDAAHARTLVAEGFGEDIAFCLTRDRTPVRALYADRQVTGERVVDPT
ncbi:MAG TPA: 2-phosphosulfolactate phosphatase [Gemmatimonadaceae bacterium]|nr:2-phosphosulfolactate phosphatase [Gemmatimonadaceae bacterium]